MKKATHPDAVGESKFSSSPTVVAIGASAGALSALRAFFGSVVNDSGLAFVVVVHLAPERESQLAELLQPHVGIPVEQVNGTERLQANRVYIIPPGQNLSAIDTHLRLSKIEARRSERAPIDHFFRTLARTHDGNSVGVLLSGAGSDGALGIQEIKARGGLTVVQDPAEAEYNSMPQSAIATGSIDLVLPAAEIAERVRRFAATNPRIAVNLEAGEAEPGAIAELSQLFALVRYRTGRDFTRYRYSTTMRRIKRRMQLAQVEAIGPYIEKLRNDPDEVRALAEDFLITVTSFFRDGEVFDELRQVVIPGLFANRSPRAPVRVWSTGCATGEEAYSLAMLLLDEAARQESVPEIQVFASDMHEASLRIAREGWYHGDIQSSVSQEHLQRYFVKDNGAYRVRKEVRDVVLFASHNLLSDPPFSKLDLVACRNLLIYLERDLQADIIDVFHYALNPDGWLVLGTAESVESSSLFHMQSKAHSFYRKRNVPGPEPRLPVFPLSRGSHFGLKQDLASNERASYGELHESLVEHYAPPSLLVSPDHRVVHLSERAGRYLRHPGGSPTANLVHLVREELQIELTSALHAAKEQDVAVWSRPVAMMIDGAPRQVVMHVRLSDKHDSDGFLLLLFEERDQPRGIHGPPSGTSSPAEHLEDDQLELTQQRLQTVIKQYEASQADMRAANEELQSANEELRSTLEELETSKEELQSTNEELQTVNQENRNKVAELSQLSSDLKSLMAATHIATLFLDRDLCIVRFTPQVAGIFNLLASDRGRPLADLTHRLGYGSLLGDAASVLESHTPLEREVADDESQWYLVRLRPYLTIDERIEGVVVTFVDITARKLSEEALRRSETRYRTLFESIDEAFCVLEAVHDSAEPGADFRILETNPAFERQTGLIGAVGQTLRELNTPYQELWLEAYERVTRAGEPTRFEVEVRLENRWFDVYAFGLPGLGNKRIAILVNEITERKHTETTLRNAAERDAFRVVLSDAVRQLGDPAEIRSVSCRLLAERLEATRVTFCESDNDGTLVPTAEVPQRLDEAPEKVPFAFDAAWCKCLEDGRSIVECGVEGKAGYGPVFAERPGEVAELGAHLSVPVLQDTRLDAALIIEDTAPRQWSESDIGLAEDAAERTWSAMQHARATSLRKSEFALREADRRKDEFLAVLSHELRNPLAPIMNSLYVIEHVPADSQRARDALAVISRQAAQMARLVDDLLDLSRVTRGNLLLEVEPVDLNEVARLTIEDFRAQFERNEVEVSLELAGEPVWIKGDRHRLAQVISNLLHNAAKFTPRGGRLFIRLEMEPGTRGVALRVKDSGVGMTPEFMARLFEPFAQADAGLDRSKSGLGLGLALARRLVERHRGTISASSDGLGRGAEFTVRFPINAKGSSRTAPPAGLESCPSRRVLIIEDKEDTAHSLRTALEFAKHEVSVAYNGSDGIDLARKLSPDVVLCDIGLPIVDGYEVARTIRADDSLKDTYLVALSGYAMPEDRQRAERAGFDRHLVKPANLAELGHILCGL